MSLLCLTLLLCSAADTDPLLAGAKMRFGTTRFRHGSAITGLAFATDGKTLASSGCDDMVRLWNVSNGREIRALRGHTATVRCVAFSSDGKMLASGSRDGTARLWNVADGKELHKLVGHESFVRSVVFTPDNKSLLSGGRDGTVRFWSVAEGKQLRQFHAKVGEIRSIALSPDGKLLAVGGEESDVLVWDVETLTPFKKYSAHEKSLTAVAFSPDGQSLLSAGRDPAINCWNVASGRFVRGIKTPEQGWPTALAFAPNGDFAWGRDGSASAYGATLWIEEKNGKGHWLTTDKSWVPAVAFSPDGKLLAAALGATIWFWDAATHKEIAPTEGHTDSIVALAYSPRGDKLITSALDDTTRIWDRATGRMIQNHAWYSNHMTWVDNNRFIAANQRRIVEWNGTAKLTSPELANPVWSLVISPDGSTLTAGAGRTVCLFNLADRFWKSLREYGDHEEIITSLAYTPDGRTLISGSWDKTILFRDMPSGQPFQRWKQPASIFALAVAPNGSLLASVGEDSIIRLWELSSGQEVGTLKGHRKRVMYLGISCDSRYLASVSDDEETLRFWDLVTGKEIHQIQGAKYSLAFAPNRRELAVAMRDTTALSFDYSSWIPPAKSTRLTAEELTDLWIDLASTDAVKARFAINRLATSPDDAIPFLAERLRSDPVPGPKEIAPLIDKLDDDSFSVREKATADLEALGRLAEPTLREVQSHKAQSLEASRRVRRVLAKHLEWPPAGQRMLRALEVLEYLDTVKSRLALKKLASGPEDEASTIQARQTLRRLESVR